MTQHYVHIELSTVSGLVKVETKGVSVAQALELIVEGLDAIKQEARTLGPWPAAELLLPE